MKRRGRLAAAMRSAGLAAVLLAVLLAGAEGLDRLVQPAWERTRAALPAAPADTPAARAAETLVSGLLGGFRGFAASLTWLHLQGSWERRDGAAVEAQVWLATRLDPRPPYFWVQGARMVAYDVPRWRLAAWRDEQGTPAPAAVERAIQREQGEKALAILAAARRVHPDDPWLVTETALVCLHRLGDYEAAAAWYRQAAEMPGAPPFAARLYGEMLRRLGRYAEARAWYEALLPTLDPTDPWSGYDLVRDRLASWTDGPEPDEAPE